MLSRYLGFHPNPLHGRVVDRIEPYRGQLGGFMAIVRGPQREHGFRGDTVEEAVALASRAAESPGWHHYA